MDSNFDQNNGQYTNQAYTQQQYTGQPNGQQAYTQQGYTDPSYAQQYTNQPYGQQVPQVVVPGHDKAVMVLIFGIVSCVTFFWGYLAVISIVAGIVGLVMASKAKGEGNAEGIRTAGFILSLVGLILGTLVFIATIVLVGAFIALFVEVLESGLY